MKTELQIGPGQVLSIPNYTSPAQCSQWLEIVLNNPDKWETRFDYIHSYGNCWYLDIEIGMLHYYHANAAKTNELLSTLPNLVSSLASSSRYLLSADGSSNLPSRPRHANLGPYWVEAGLILMTGESEGAIHADYEGLSPYPDKLFDPETRAYSAVLCLATGESGGNLKIWKKHVLANETPPDDNSYFEEVIYKQATLALFDSFCYHQISSSVLTDDHRYRAVAAMHFLYKEEPYPHWEYWF